MLVLSHSIAHTSGWRRKYGIAKLALLRGSSGLIDAVNALKEIGYGHEAAYCETMDWLREREQRK